MRSIRNIYKAEFEVIGDLITYRAFPTPLFPMNQLDPFILLNHHGRQLYQPKNGGLPFGPHPHRGIETLTFILEGDLMHTDSSRCSSIIKAGGIQWMTAGRGLVHAEMSSERFREEGGHLEILQLWINLPAKFKMTDPGYIGLQYEELPSETFEKGVCTTIISGNWNGVEGPVHPLTDVDICLIRLENGAETGFSIPKGKNILLYMVKGEIIVNGRNVTMHHTVDFENDNELVKIKAIFPSTVIFGHASPLREPFAAGGPFVMNSNEELSLAYEDYRKGLFGDEHNL